MKDEKVIVYEDIVTEKINFSGKDSKGKDYNIQGFVVTDNDKELPNYVYFDENQLKYAIATHKRCSCGKLFPINSGGYTICDNCRDKAEKEKYSKLPIVNNPIYPLYCNDKYLFNSDDLLGFIDDYLVINESTKIDDSTFMIYPTRKVEMSEVNLYDCLEDMETDDEDINDILGLDSNGISIGELNDNLNKSLQEMYINGNPSYECDESQRVLLSSLIDLNSINLE
jgi:hypothetical protein